VDNVVKGSGPTTKQRNHNQNSWRLGSGGKGENRPQRVAGRGRVLMGPDARRANRLSDITIIEVIVLAMYLKMHEI